MCVAYVSVRMCLRKREAEREGERKGRNEGWREGKYKGNHDQEVRYFAWGREVNKICDIKAELGCMRSEKRPVRGCRAGIRCEGSQEDESTKYDT